MNARVKRADVYRYRILTKSGMNGKWWGETTTLWAANADEAAEAFISDIGANPPNEIAVQSTASSSNGAFKLYRVKPRAAYEIEVI